jgi:hypothetical protein
MHSLKTFSLCFGILVTLGACQSDDPNPIEGQFLVMINGETWIPDVVSDVTWYQDVLSFGASGETQIAGESYAVRISIHHPKIGLNEVTIDNESTIAIDRFMSDLGTIDFVENGTVEFTILDQENGLVSGTFEGTAADYDLAGGTFQSMTIAELFCKPDIVKADEKPTNLFTSWQLEALESNDEMNYPPCEREVVLSFETEGDDQGWISLKNVINAMGVSFVMMEDNITTELGASTLVGGAPWDLGYEWQVSNFFHDAVITHELKRKSLILTNTSTLEKMHLTAID